MFINNLDDSSSSSIIDIVSLSKRLCSQAESLRARLQESIDDDDLSSAVKIAETAVTNDVIVPLLAMMQCVERDAENDFRPIVVRGGDDGNSSSAAAALTDMADVALLTLSDLYMVAEAFLKSNGWIPVDNESAPVQGGIVYEHEGSGEQTDEPELDNGTTWQMKLMLAIPVLIYPGCVEGRVVWAADVVYYQRLHTTCSATGIQDYLQQFDLECEPTTGAGVTITNSCVAVVDVLKSDEDGQGSCMRGTYHGCWHGLYAEAVGEMDMSTSIGQVLESWTDTTLVGLSDTTSSARVLVIGLASGQLISFLQQHNPNVQLQVVEASSTAVDIAVKYYNLHPSMLDCVTVADPLEYVKSQCLKGGEFDTIIVNVCSIEELFPTFLLNDTCFNGLMAMLSNHPSATLLVNSGISADTVVALVDDACKHGHRHGHMLVLREHLLRDADRGNTGVIVAARQREWSLSAADWQREYMGEQFQSSGAMAMADAQRTQVVRLDKFLSVQDIQLIHSVAKDTLASSSGIIESALTSPSEGVQVHTDSWKVLYLQHNDVFQRKLPALRQRILEAIRTVDKCNWSLFDNVDHVNIRVVEYHQMNEFGELADPKHYDLNSLLTMDIMLSEEGAFEGGDLQTEEADGTLKTHEFNQGDALVFVSHKPHCVGRVRAGRRNVMVLEFWYGPERQCPHRCERFGQEICTKDPAQHLYTQAHPHLHSQHEHEHEHKLEQGNSPSIPLPFRLGSVAVCKEGSREILELLWEPNGNADIEVEAVPDKVTEEVEDDMDEVWALFD